MWIQLPSVPAPSQVFIYSVANWNTPHILDMRAGASLIVQAEKHFLTLDTAQGIQVRDARTLGTWRMRPYASPCDSRSNALCGDEMEKEVSSLRRTGATSTNKLAPPTEAHAIQPISMHACRTFRRNSGRTIPYLV